MEQFLFCCNTSAIHHLFVRYINDCIGAASCSHEQLEQFINFTNTFQTNLKLTWTIYKIALSFLDLSVSISGPRQIFHIRQEFTCTSSNLIYRICCSRCGLLYIGETKSRLSDRSAEHLGSICNNTFLLLIMILTDVLLLPTVDPSSPKCYILKNCMVVSTLKQSGMPCSEVKLLT
eukprot:g34088.t1